MSGRKNKSLVWQYFKKTGENKAECIYCKQQISYAGSTTNLASHVKRRHKEPLLALRPTNEISLINSEMAETSGVKAVNNSLMKMIAKDLQPLSVVENVGFQNFVRELNPLFQLPSRKKLTYEVLPEMFKETKTMILEHHHQIDHCSITTDVWTSDANM